MVVRVINGVKKNDMEPLKEKTKSKQLLSRYSNTYVNGEGRLGTMAMSGIDVA